MSLYFGSSSVPYLETGVSYTTNVVVLPQIFATNRSSGGGGTNISADPSVSWLVPTYQSGGFSNGNRYEQWVIRVTPNGTGSQRNGRVAFSYRDDSGENFSSLVYVTQGIDSNSFPVWRDIYHIIDNQTAVTYDVMCDGSTVYSGKAVMSPDGKPIRINMSRIAQDYLSTYIGADWVGQSGIVIAHTDAAKEFDIYVNGTLSGNYKFVNDWSYIDRVYGSTNQFLNFPINGKADPRMYLFYTVYQNVTGSSNATIYLDGTATDFRVQGDVPNTIVLDAGNYAEVRTSYGVRYKVEYCAPYALYYRNRYGGYDSLMVEGNMVSKDSYTVYNVQQNYDNNTIQWGDKNYHNTVRTSYTLYTGWLNDEQAKRLNYNLMASNEVYLHILDSDEIYPVVLTIGDSEYKTYKNQGMRLVNYTITADASQKKQNL